MKRRRWFVPIFLTLGLLLWFPGRLVLSAQAPGAQQGYSVTIMNICGSSQAPETIHILRVTLAMVATQAGPRSLSTGQMTTFQFPVSQFPILGVVTPNHVSIEWRRGEQTFTTLFFPIPLGQPQEQACLRVLLISGLEGETGTVFGQVRSLISNTASRLNVSVDPNQAKLFQIGNAPIVVAPATTGFPTLGAMELGTPMNIDGVLLPPGSYKLDLDFSTRKVLFRDPMGLIRAQMDARIEPVAGPSAMTQGPLALTVTSTCQAATSSEEPLEPMAFMGCIGPTISFSLTFIPVPPFVLLLTCIGFLCHPFHPNPPYISVGFCF